LLISIVSLLTVILESARTAGIRYRLELAANSSMESVFAGYQKELFDRYHLLFLWKTPKNVKEEMQDYLSYYFEPSKGTIRSGGNFFSIHLETIDILEVMTATDKGGCVFEQEAVDALGYTVVMEQVNSLMEQWESLKEGETVYQDIHAEDEEVKEFLGNGTDFFEEAEEEEISSGFLEQLANMVGNMSWNALILEEGAISKKTIELSGLPTREVSRHEDNAGDLLKSCAFTLYIQKYFSCYTVRKNTYSENNGLVYEQEYILNGFSKDIDNLKATVGKLLLLREGMNLIYLLNDSKKMAEAEGLAIFICSLIGLPELTDVLKSFILGVWAYDESVKDMRKLLKGEKVPLIKNESGTGEGLSYENYLELFLLIHNREAKIYRTMDVVQINVSVNHPGFFLRDCIYEIELQITIKDDRKRERVLTWLRNYY